MSAISLRGVSKRYQGRPIVDDLSLSIEEGETFVLIGPSGCGKSTTLKMINRLVEPDAGSVSVGGRDVRASDAASLRLGIGYVIQDAGLFAHWTVRRNVGLVPRLLGWPARRIEARTDELLALVGLPAEDFGDRYPRQLSGGQRQRVGIARALAADPPIVLLDEPFGALDPITRERMQEEFLRLSETLHKTFLLVTHDIFEAARLADRIGVMREGRLVQCGSPATIVRRPADSFVSSLLGRHRFELRLLTLSLEDACRGLGAGAAPAARSTTLSPAASAWEALAAMEDEGTALLRLQRDHEPVRFVARTELLAALERDDASRAEAPWESARTSS
jgi:osmoprotectant transport system ATP-binding protein